MVPFTLVFASRAISHLPSFPLSITMTSSPTSTTGPVAWYVLLPAHAKDDTSSIAMHTTIHFMTVLLMMRRIPGLATREKSFSSRLARCLHLLLAQGALLFDRLLQH